ncbi:hypothetical protein C8Q80DRAFT_673877 [Daedaleopsis nitida]|nr:hypothetical protein C8Q80DRAFT_673877 [Daedaleopsis nitida]
MPQACRPRSMESMLFLMLMKGIKCSTASTAQSSSQVTTSYVYPTMANLHLASNTEAGDIQAGNDPAADDKEEETHVRLFARDVLAQYYRLVRQEIYSPDWPRGGISLQPPHDDVPTPALPGPICMASSSTDQPEDEQPLLMTIDERQAVLSNTYCHYCVLGVHHRTLDPIPPGYLLLSLLGPHSGGNPHKPAVKCLDAACKRRGKPLCLFCVYRICDLEL